MFLNTKSRDEKLVSNAKNDSRPAWDIADRNENGASGLHSLHHRGITHTLHSSSRLQINFKLKLLPSEIM